MLIDAHMHLWKVSRGDYGWLTPEFADLYRDFSSNDYSSATRDLPTMRSLVVQAAPTEAETGWLLDRLASSPLLAGVIGWLDIDAADAPARVARLGSDIVGIRPMLQDDPDAERILSAHHRPVFEALAAAGLVFDALVRSHQLSIVGALAARHPTLAIVLDHGGKPAIGAGTWQPWANDIATLAEYSNVACKLSGLLTEAPAGADEAVLRPWVAHIFACFGEKRVMWGSDWPVVTTRRSLLDWFGIAQRLVDQAGMDRAAVLGGNAARLYRLEGALA